MKYAGAAAVTLACLAMGHTSARARAKDAATAAGLDRPRERAPARGIQTLRPPLEGRVRIAGGRFIMGSTPIEMVDALRMCRREQLSSLCEENDLRNDFRAEGFAHEVTLHPFDLDRTEVRVGDYARCVIATRCTAPTFAPGDPRFDRPEYPVTKVRWEDAATYCAWAGGRLPTEAEWEFAARGPSRRTFPWGMTFGTRLANHGALAFDATDASDGFALLAPVGSFPDGATPQGVLDLAGSVQEWVSDFWGELDDEGHGYPPEPQIDPQGPKTGVFHVIRGGSYQRGQAWLRAATRAKLILPRSADVGFRCAADVK